MQSVSLPADDLALALELVDLADEITLNRFGATDLVVETKPDLTPVTEADKDVERAVRERISKERPGDVVVGEEYGEGPGDGNRRWIIDPIDGTKGYVRRLPVWATLLALEVDGELTVGAVSAPALGRRWWAARGHGAHVSTTTSEGGEARELGVSGVQALGDAQLCFGGLEEWEQVGRVDALLELGRACWRTRGFGDFWGYMIVAEGSAEIMLDPIVSVWDLAAPFVIVEEAGGRFTDLAGRRTAGGDSLATNSHVHEAALEIVGR
jgi:histidinol-phosphatase